MMNREKIIALLEYNTIFEIMNEYEMSEELILDCLDLLPITIICQDYKFSEDFVIKALKTDYFTEEHIQDLNMQTYIGLSQEFIEKYGEYINWGRMILYISTQSDDFSKYAQIIENNDLWDLISCNDLPIDFIREHKDKLNWNKLTIVKLFNVEECEEFKDYIVNYESQTNSYFNLSNDSNEIIIDDDVYDKIMNLVNADSTNEKTTL